MAKEKTKRDPLANLGGLYADLDTPQQEVSIGTLIPFTGQPRRYIDPEAIQALAHSIQQVGILQPLLVRPSAQTGKYDIICGNSRFQAAKQVGLETVPVVIQDLSDSEAFKITLVENLTRKALDVVDETEGILRYLAIELDCPFDEAAKRIKTNAWNAKLRESTSSEIQSIFTFFDSLGMSPETFRKHRLPLLRLPDFLLRAVREGKLPSSSVLPIARLPDEASQQDLLDQALQGQWTRSRIQREVKARLQSQSPSQNSWEQLRDRAKSVTTSLQKQGDNLEESTATQVEELLSQIENLLK